MKITITEEQVKGLGKAGLRIGKAVIIEGTKALVLKGAATAITKGFENGFSSIKDITLDDVLGEEEKKDKSKKKKLFGRKNKDVVVEATVEVGDDIPEVERTEVTE